MSDEALRQAVMDELEWEPSVDAAHIGVAAKDGVITITGDVDTYAEKLAAEHAAGRVIGVKAVAQELKVRYPSDPPNDSEIARSVLQAFQADTQVPADALSVKVQHGFVTLSGTVDWQFQSRAAAESVHKLRGVVGVLNEIKILPRARAIEVKDKIRAAYSRNAQIDAGRINVAADGGKVTLTGEVDSWYQRTLAEDTAWSAPGVSSVDDRLVVI